MSMVANKTFTLGELAKIALGATELTTDHLSVLQSLLIILLQKLDCHNESVRIIGFPAKCTQDLLKENTNVMRYNFQKEAIKGFKEKYKILDNMERKTKEIDLKMQKHFEQIRKKYKKSPYSLNMWESYTGPTEDICPIFSYHDHNDCELARNFTFNIELLERVLPPVQKRFDEFETKVLTMKSELEKLEKMANRLSPKLSDVKFIFKDIESIRRFLFKGNKDFRIAMLEMDEMLDCKLHRVTLPALKRYLERRFTEIRERLRVLKNVADLPSSSKPFLLKDREKCLSCGPLQQLVELTEIEKLHNNKPVTCVDELKEPSLLEKIDRMQRSMLN